VSHIVSLLVRMEEHGRVHGRTVEQEGVTEKRCYTSGSHTTRPSDVVKSVQDFEGLDDRISVNRVSNSNIFEDIREFDQIIEKLWENREEINKRATSLEDGCLDRLFEIKMKIEDIEQQLQDEDTKDEFNWFDWDAEDVE